MLPAIFKENNIYNNILFYIISAIIILPLIYANQYPLINLTYKIITTITIIFILAFIKKITDLIGYFNNILPSFVFLLLFIVFILLDFTFQSIISLLLFSATIYFLLKIYNSQNIQKELFYLGLLYGSAVIIDFFNIFFLILIIIANIFIRKFSIIDFLNFITSFLMVIFCYDLYLLYAFDIHIFNKFKLHNVSFIHNKLYFFFFLHLLLSLFLISLRFNLLSVQFRQYYNMLLTTFFIFSVLSLFIKTYNILAFQIFLLSFLISLITTDVKNQYFNKKFLLSLFFSYFVILIIVLL